MNCLWKILISLSMASKIQTSLYRSISIEDNQEVLDGWQNILTDIYEERPFETLLLIEYQTSWRTSIWDGLCAEKLGVPKMLMNINGKQFLYKDHYNKDIFAVVFLNDITEIILMQAVAHILDYIRQSRILILASREVNRKKLQEELLTYLEIYKMTNVLLKFIDGNEELLMLEPYASYHWKKLHRKGSLLYPQHWRNLHKRSILTYTDQTLPRALLFRDPKDGQLRLNGYLPRLLMLFTELFNGTLEMFKPVIMGDITHYLAINSMVEEDLLDIPMVLDTIGDERWLNMSDIFEVDKGLLMIPCPKSRSINEVYIMMFEGNLFIFILVCLISLSLLHSLCDYVRGIQWRFINFIFSDKILPGLLGQSFPYRKISLLSLKMEADLILPAKEEIRKVALMSSNISYVLENRHNFNTDYGYYTSATMWRIFKRKQNYFSHKVFCTSEDLTVFRYLPWGLRLQYNSPFKEGLNYLIHRVHDLGLMDAWHSSLFTDMLKMKVISIRDPFPDHSISILTINDLLWIWIMFAVGLILSFLVFLIELLWSFCNRCKNIRLLYGKRRRIKLKKFYNKEKK
ncbi:uncharacterized protein LOC142224460 [Haematobia irritans]|uniref:uncharacterized protein LOC142224460 n=1 Tax=Haematobia irritans TaxID=7368 RepID=UPI003F50C563